MKKPVSILCAGAMLLSLAACGAKADTTYAGQTITSLTNSGTINFNGYTITLADGTVLQ